MTPGRLLYLLRRRIRLGFNHWYAERFVMVRITDWRVDAHLPLSQVPLHMLASKQDWKMALWMLVSLHEATGRRWPVVLHEDGSLGEEEFLIFRQMFPDIRIVTRREADSEMNEVLRDFSRCAEYRQRMPHGLKSFDIPHFCQSDRFLMIDPDVLFFQRPQEILDWVDRPNDGTCWFNQDFQEPSPISASQAKADLGVNLWPQVNSGLCLLQRQAVSDLDVMEGYLAHPALQNPKIQWRVEQTLLALSASREKKGGLLPETYEVSPNKHRIRGGVVRHYVGCVRDRFMSEGVIYIIKTKNMKLFNFIKSKIQTLKFRIAWAQIGYIYFKSSNFHPEKLKIHGKKINLNFPSGEYDVLLHELGRIYIEDCYRLKNLEKTPKIIVDIGANVGLFSLVARQLFPKARIMAFEPNPDLMELLRSHLEPLDIEIYPYAVGLVNGLVNLNKGDNSLLSKCTTHEKGIIRLMSIKDVVSEAGGHIDILKLDCEGAEWDIINDADSIGKVNNLVMEYHLWAKYGSTLSDLINKFKNLGFHIQWHENKEGLSWGLIGLKNIL